MKSLEDYEKSRFHQQKQKKKKKKQSDQHPYDPTGKSPATTGLRPRPRRRRRFPASSSSSSSSSSCAADGTGKLRGEPTGCAEGEGWEGERFLHGEGGGGGQGNATGEVRAREDAGGGQFREGEVRRGRRVRPGVRRQDHRQGQDHQPQDHRSDKARDRHIEAPQASQRGQIARGLGEQNQDLHGPGICNGGELFNRIASRGRLPEAEGRKLFQQLIDGVSYCHDKGVFHRDLKLENILVDSRGNIKITDFGLSALPQHFRDDGLLHTTCGSPNYVAPEVLKNRGYDGSTSDVWSCGVILYAILTGYLPFDDRNLAVLYQKIFKGEAHIAKWLSPGAKSLIRRILDPNPATRLTMDGIKADNWFRQDYNPANPDDEESIFIDDEAFSMQDVTSEGEKSPRSPTLINAFQLIGMSSCLDLSGFFEKEDISERKIRFTSNHSAKDLIKRIEDTVTEMGFRVQKRNGRLKVMQEQKGQKSPGSLSVAAEVFEISPSLFVVELRKSYGDSTVYRQLCKRLSNELGVPQNQQLLTSGL
ncbi:hypothetical protein NL676_031080 [Syzygium grande]|nr:hypothetical protein NL676_031080 [Syzygium grande]